MRRWITVFMSGSEENLNKEDYAEEPRLKQRLKISIKARPMRESGMKGNWQATILIREESMMSFHFQKRKRERNIFILRAASIKAQL